jgi:branched-subunit amino acid aminotransferase/4-amino-4-deoxychorismate lyase
VTVPSSGTPRHVWLDGRLLPAEEPHLSAFDRGFQLGDGVFETLRSHAGRGVELDEHLNRLALSAAGLHIALPDGHRDALRAAIAHLLAAESLDGPGADAAIRITLTRGTFTGRGLLTPDDLTPTLCVQAWPVTAPPAGHLEHGLRLATSRIRRDPANPLAALKTISRADSIVARLEAREAGADDALFLTTDGRVSEASTANVFVVREGALLTPGRTAAILPGTTRDWLLGWAESAGLRAQEADLRPDDLLAADEAFLSSSVAGVLPATRLDGEPIGAGLPGPYARRARADREAWVRASAAGEAGTRA